MEVTKLSSDKSEILVQLYDSLEDVLEKGNELDKKILEQMDAFNKVEKELSDLDKRFDDLKSKNVDNLTTNGAKDAGDIVREIISKKKEKQDLLDTDQILYKEYISIKSLGKVSIIPLSKFIEYFSCFFTPFGLIISILLQ